MRTRVTISFNFAECFNKFTWNSSDLIFGCLLWELCVIISGVNSEAFIDLLLLDIVYLFLKWIQCKLGWVVYICATLVCCSTLRRKASHKLIGHRLSYSGGSGGVLNNTTRRLLLLKGLEDEGVKVSDQETMLLLIFLHELHPLTKSFYLCF